MQELLKTTKQNKEVELFNPLIYNDFFFNPVGQLAKSPCPTLKALSVKENTVGRHKKNLHDEQISKRIKKQTKNLQKEAKLRSMQLEVFIALIKELAPKIKVKDEYWFSKYNDAIKIELSEQDYLLLKQLIRSFTILNSNRRTQTAENTYLVSEQDYLFAFRLLKWKNKPLKRAKNLAPTEFLDKIEWYFYDEEFSSKEIKQKLRIYSYYRIREILNFFIKEKKIEKAGHWKYRLILNT